MKLLILEDENFTRKYLKELVQRNKNIDEVYATGDVNEALEIVGSELPQIGLIDIELPEQYINGLEASRTAQQINPEMEFIFVTAYSQYALKSFEVHPYDYFVKPVGEENLLESVNNIVERIKANLSYKKLILDEPGEVLQIPMHKILFLEKIKEQKKVSIYLEDDEVYQVSKTLNELEEMLDINFVRSHRSYIVNKHKIRKITAISQKFYEAYFENFDKTALVSRYRLDLLKKSLSET
ncbi:LytR/AlgR family response regulator transcription factor [Natranaerobius thermophilus]|uniref:Stage 0 sporulation protein A homolog n=1 Tax=Natranaerobius thermophilus (strain ATCC BAA-1301 / DSM 18059 / JW/NM-WN-LF) TaxID=457570 RepID=B2A7J9_NATTJ|nr:LytTR family DNA-binding domain-containing protein [Natranaerobius thermophilus]ACB85708.1 two component transcriptional regulator, LytTR family [Natranaerobius thermophilus JW/NM-WN-LF]